MMLPSLVSFSVFDPWLWIMAAMALAILEAVIPGYVLLGFGIGAGAVAIALFPLEEQARSLPYAPMALMVIWSAASVVAWLGLTAAFGRPSRRTPGERDLNDFDNSM